MTDSIEKHTVAMHFVTSAVAHLSLSAKDRALAAAGIPAQLLQQGHARVPATAFSALWLAVARELNDEFFGLDQRSMKVGSFSLICQAALSCTNLDRALRRILRGLAVFLDDVQADLHLEGDNALVRLTNRISDGADRQFADETFLVLVHGLMCWLAGRRIALSHVSFTHARPSHAREYSLMFGENLQFDAPLTAMQFAREALSAPIIQDRFTLQRFLQTAPESVFLKYRNEDSWAAKLRRRLRDCISEPATWPSFSVLATEFNITAATLRRRLEQEETSYKDIKDHLRSDLAIDFLCNSALSIDDISARLGFQDPSAFHRAFKRWNGVQPGGYRRQKLAGAHDDAQRVTSTTIVHQQDL